MPCKSSVVACPLHHLLTDGAAADLRVAVQRTHEAVVVGSALINTYLRDRLEAYDAGTLDRAGVLAALGVSFSEDWVKKALVLASGGASNTAPEHLRRVWAEMCAGDFAPPPGCGAKTNYMRAYAARSIAAAAKTALAFRFYDRVKAHVRLVHRLDHDQWLALSAQERRSRKLQFARMLKDVVRKGGDTMVSDPAHHAWVTSTRALLGLDVLLVDNSLSYQIKACSSKCNPRVPAAILLATWRLSIARWRLTGKAYSIFPLRTTMTPRFCHVDLEVLGQATAATRVERAKRKRKRAAPGSDVAAAAAAAAAAEASLLQEKRDTFAQVLRPGWEKRVGHSDRFAFAFDTDGVSARLLLKREVPAATVLSGHLPSRGLHYIDDLKKRRNVIDDDMHVIGVDPGKIELMVASNDRRRGAADPRPLYRSVRYTSAQRRFELKTIVAQKKLEALRRENSIDDLESDLARHNQRAPTLAAFTEYLQEHFRTMRARLDFYSSLSLRRRRWRSYVLGQKSIARLKNRVRKMAPKGARVALAWGAWGLVSGAACSKGNPPALGVGLMNEFAKDFLVVPTPEHHTSSTCSKCLRSGRGPRDAGACTTIEANRSSKIRGLRFCPTCSSHLNRDRNASLNIAMNLRLYMTRGSGIRALTADDQELISADAGDG